MNILERIESNLSDFRPRTQREFVALQLARRFDDLSNLARYLVAAQHHSKHSMFEAAKTAHTRHELNRAPIAQLFFEALAERERIES
jgi:hypothetical protein